MAEMRAFEFRQCARILKATGKKAATLRELRDIIAVVAGESIYHHTYEYFMKEHVQEYTNDFAHWAGENLEERTLAEQLSNIDPYDFREVEDLRKEILRVIDDYLERFPEPRAAMPGDEFHFSQTVSLTFHSGIRVRNLAEFLIGIRHVDSGAIYHHFYESKMRLGSKNDDFSAWIEGAMDKPDIAEKIRAIDPFMHNVEGIRSHIVDAIEEAVKRDMEAIE